MKKLVLILIFTSFCLITFGQNNNQTVTDIDGNIYHTVTIGTQTWMTENLKVTTYNNGAPIIYVPGDESWGNITGGAYCWYNSNIVSKKTYGALYNWEAVSSGVLAPKGWHVPTTKDWKVLIAFLGGEKVAGGKLKEAGTNHWAAPNTGADNSSDFTALPGGGRIMAPWDFLAIGYKGWWWSSTKKNIFKAYFVAISYGLSEVGISKINRSSGLSVRCIKD